MNDRYAADNQYHSMRDWRQENVGPVPFSPEQQGPGQQLSHNGTNGTYAPDGSGPGQPPFPVNPHYQAASQPQFPAGPAYPSATGQAGMGNGAYQQYGTTPAAGPNYAGGPAQQYGPGPGQAQYVSGPLAQPYTPGSQYSASPAQQYGQPPQPAFGSGAYQQASPSGQLPYAGGQQYNGAPSPSTMGQPHFNNGAYQQASPSGQFPYPGNQYYAQAAASGAPGAPDPNLAQHPPFYQAQPSHVPYSYAPAQEKSGIGWKALFFIVPVVLVVCASIFGPSVVSNMMQGRHPLAAVQPQTQTSAELSQKQLQSIQQYNNDMYYKQLARLYVSQMTLDEKIGQLMVVTYNTNTYSQDLDYMLNQQHVGGVIMYQLSFEHQLQSIDQVKRDTAMMQQRATFPLFISIDEEGWNVDRLSQLYPTPPNPKRLAADDIHQSGNPAVATSEGQRVAHDMMAVGINVNFAPDVDVALNHGYIDWDYRAFGENPDDVLKYSAPYLEAMQAGGVIGTLKHFVGLGAVPRGNNYDPHFVLPSVDLTPEQINTHLIPFKHFIQSPNKLDHPGFIMPTDLMVPSIDPKYPTEFSHIFITDILRKQLGYDGVVITDGLQMGGVKVNGETLTEASASLLALRAGCDMLLDISGSQQVADVITTIKGALQDGSLTQARIDEAVTRIITLKMERNIVPSIQGENLNA